MTKVFTPPRTKRILQKYWRSWYCQKKANARKQELKRNLLRHLSERAVNIQRWNLPSMPWKFMAWIIVRIKDLMRSSVMCHSQYGVETYKRQVQFFSKKRV